MARSTEYFERARSTRNFVAALFFGVVAGGIFSIVFSEITSYIKTSYLSPYIVPISLSIGIVVFVLSVVYSYRAEGITMEIPLFLDSATFVGIINTAQICLEQRNEPYTGKLKEILFRLNALLGTKSALESANMGVVGGSALELHKIIVMVKDEPLKGSLQKICDYLNNIEDLSNKLVKSMHAHTSVFKQRGLCIRERQDGLEVYSKTWTSSKTLIKLIVTSNSGISLYCPAFCHATTYPNTTVIEHRRLLKEAQQVLSGATSDRSLIEMGLRLVFPDEEYWERFKEELRPILRETFSDFRVESETGTP